MEQVRVYTHNGTFHTDDVFSVAIVRLLEAGKELKVIRTRDLSSVVKGDWVLDVGGVYDPKQNHFDHHQSDFSIRHENGALFATTGLLWKEYGERLSGNSFSANYINKRLVEFIDAADNGVDFQNKNLNFDIFTIYDLIEKTFRPTLRELESGGDYLPYFLRAVDLAEEIIKRQIIIANDLLLDKEAVMNLYNQSLDKRILKLDKSYSWKNLVPDMPELLYVIAYDNERGHWRIIAARNDPNSFEMRKPLPAEWGGKSDGELQKITGVPDAIFCHHRLFTAGAKSFEGIMKMAEIALKS